MDNLVKEVLQKGLFNIEGQGDEQNHFMAMIQRFADIRSKFSDAARVCDYFARIIIEESSFENCSILLWDAGRKKLSLTAAYGLEDQLGTAAWRRYRPSLLLDVGEGISGQVFGTGEPVYIENSAKQPIPELKDAVITPISLACIPLLQIGVLNVSSFHPCEFPALARRNWETMGQVMAYLLVGQRNAPDSGANRGSLPMEKMGLPISFPAPDSYISDLVLDALPHGICILDKKGDVIRLNRAIEKLQGENFPEIISRSPAILFHDPKVFGKLLNRVSESESGQAEKTDVQLMNSMGETYLADVNLVRLNDPSGSMGYLLVIEDMTRKKAFSDRIIQSEKLAALGTMAGGVSHDFNNLLMAILGHIQLILTQVQDEEIRRRLQNIEKAVYDGSNTVRRLQRFTEREREPKAVASTVDVNEAVKDVIELTKPRWKNFMERSGQMIDLQLDLSGDCLAAINASDLREVITNLLLNAIDAMPEGGTLGFKTICQGEHVVIEISDTGIGMSKEIAEKIFDPFFTTKGIGNSGLGLSVSWSLLGRYGGDIQVRSKQGKGTTFLLKLVRAEALKVQPGGQAVEGTSSYRLLLVEDDPEILNILRDMLRLKGHRVMAVNDSEKALDIIDSNEFDLVLTDLGMPVVSGWDIAKRVKQKDPKIPVVMITGWGAQFEDEDLTSRGVDLMLAKPLSWDKLLGSIEKML